MSIIDDKGSIHIFGVKINIIDFILICIIAVILFSGIPACIKISSPERKAIQAKILIEEGEKTRQKITDEMTSERKQVYDELSEARHNVIRLDREAEEMIKLQKVWIEGVKAGYIEGYSDGKSEK